MKPLKTPNSSSDIFSAVCYATQLRKFKSNTDGSVANICLCFRNPRVKELNKYAKSFFRNFKNIQPDSREMTAANVKIYQREVAELSKYVKIPESFFHNASK
jgi:hypothetical protein